MESLFITKHHRTGVNHRFEEPFLQTKRNSEHAEINAFCKAFWLECASTVNDTLRKRICQCNALYSIQIFSI